MEKSMYSSTIYLVHIVRTYKSCYFLSSNSNVCTILGCMYWSLHVVCMCVPPRSQWDLGSLGLQPEECDNLCQVVLNLLYDDWWMSTIIKSLSQHPCLFCVACILALGSQFPSSFLSLMDHQLVAQCTNWYYRTVVTPGQEISCSSANHARSSKSNVGDKILLSW